MKTLPYHSVGKQTVNGVTAQLYSFKCLFNQPYIVEVEEHEHSIFIIQFYKKSHKLSENKYYLLNDPSIRTTKDGTLLNGSENFLTILNTMIAIMLEVYKKNKNASFGFMGAPTLAELDKEKNKHKINEDGTVKETKRFNTYSIYVKRYFSPKQFQHIEIETSSCYLIKSNTNTHLTLQHVEEFFKTYLGL